MEIVIKADVVYVPVDDAGEPHLWGDPDEALVSAYGSFWCARRDAASAGRGKLRRVWALALEDLQELLCGRWSHVTGVVYFPDVDGRQLSREEISEMGAA